VHQLDKPTVTQQQARRDLVDRIQLLVSLTNTWQHNVQKAAGRAWFLEAQREDHYDRPAEDVVRPVARAFPDEPSFEIKRWG
jgi:hypothetical protein